MSVTCNEKTFPATMKYTVVVVVCADDAANQVAGLFSFDPTAKATTFAAHFLKAGASYHALAFHFYTVLNPFPKSKQSSASNRRLGMCVVPLMKIGKPVRFEIISEKGWPLAVFKTLSIVKQKGFTTSPSLVLSSFPPPRIPPAMLTDEVEQHMYCIVKGHRLPFGVAIAVTAFGQPAALCSYNHTRLFRVWLSLTKSGMGITERLTLDMLQTSPATRREFIGDFFSTMFRGLLYSGDFMPEAGKKGFVCAEEWCPVTYMPNQEHASYDCEDAVFTIIHIVQAFKRIAFSDHDPELQAIQQLLKEYECGFGICKLRENLASNQLAWHAICVFMKKDYLQGTSKTSDLMFVDATHSLQHDLTRKDNGLITTAYEKYKNWLDANTKGWPLVWRLHVHLKMPAYQLRQYRVYNRLFSVVWVDGSDVRHSLMPVTSSLLEYFDPMTASPVVINSVSSEQLKITYRPLASSNPPPRLPLPPAMFSTTPPPALQDNQFRMIMRAPVSVTVGETLRQLATSNTNLTVTTLDVFANCSVSLYDFTPKTESKT
jgi:hypothetical protein